MARKSAGILLYRFRDGIFEVLIVHPGGPFWKKKDQGAWSIPKGEFDEDEEPLDAAIREFREETGITVSCDFIPLTPVRLRSGKLIYAFAVEKDLDPSTFKSNTFPIEWPPKSGKVQEFPEIDRAEWVDFETAKIKLNESQALLIEELVKKLNLRTDQ